MIDYQLKTLPNGLTLIQAPLHDTSAVTILVLVGVGSRYETKEENGISHFLEHLFFKGTKKRPSTLKLSKELDAMGARYNAFTGEEVTGFYIQAAAKKFARAWDVLSDMLLNPLIPEKEVERERGVILEEMNMYYDTPQAYVGELAKATVFGDTPLGRDVIGVKATVGRITRQQIIDYRARHYVPSNITVVVAGVPKGEWEQTVIKTLSGHKGAKVSSFEAVSSHGRGPIVDLHHKATDQTHLVVSIKTFPITDPRYHTLKLLSGILGGQMSSRLFIKIRERRGLAYYISSEVDNFHDTGLLSITAGLKTSSISEALRIIRLELQSLKTKLVTKEELTRVKDNLTGKMALALEGSFPVAEFLAEQHFYEDKIRQPEELLKVYQSVSASDIMKLAEQLFTPDNIKVTAIGPLTEKNKSKFEKILNN
jgi:predicted Zn-dependent peptidase